MTEREQEELDELQVKCALLRNRLAFFRRFLSLLRQRVLSSSASDMYRYRQLRHCISSTPELNVEPDDDAEVGADGVALTDVVVDSDLVPVKISLLGDCNIGKTSFMMKYVGDGEEQVRLEMRGLNLMDKMFSIRGARIMHSIWDVRGDHQFLYHLPIACKDSAAILFMFDLTNRCTLNNVIDWYMQARRWNKTAITILIGTKFDDFIKLPVDIQWTVVTQARAFARALNATLFFSSAAHNINVDKIFKFVTAKIFNLPWTVKRNLAPGEPIIDF